MLPSDYKKGNIDYEIAEINSLDIMYANTHCERMTIGMNHLRAEYRV